MENSPTELSTKKPCGRHLYEFNEKTKSIDPRFQNNGDYDKIEFIKNYSFLQNNRKFEIKNMEKDLGDLNNKNSKEELKKKLQSLRDQYKTNEIKINDTLERLKWHKEEKERISQGKKPFWVNKKEMKEITYKKKFEDLKNSGKLNNYLKKRRKKLISKDKKESLM